MILHVLLLFACTHTKHMLGSNGTCKGIDIQGGLQSDFMLMPRSKCFLYNV